MNKLISEQDLQKELTKLPDEMSPQRELWSGIERAIQAQSQESSHNNKKLVVPLSWAASVVAAVLITWITLAPQYTNQAPSLNLAAVMQQDFDQQKQMMLVSFGQPKITDLPTEMQQELTKLSSAQATIKKALEADPNNSDLLNLLRWTQKQELDLLKQLYSPQWQTI